VSITFVARAIIHFQATPKLHQPKKELAAMSEWPVSGPPQFSRMIAVGLQALAVACLVSWLVLFHRRRAAPEDAQSHEGAKLETPGPSRKGGHETANELVWIGNATNTADEPVPFDEDPFSLLHFRVRLPAGHSRKASSESRTQPVELVFHSSWSSAPDAISFHISSDGVSAFCGSYLRQYPLHGTGRSGNFAVRDAGTIQVSPPYIAKAKATKRSRETWRACLIIISVVVSLASIALGVADLLALRNNASANQFTWPQEAESQPLELWDQAWKVLELWAEVAEPLMPDETPNNSNNIHTAFHSLPNPYQTIPDLCAQLSFISSSTSGVDTGASAGSANARETISVRYR
jgi:hypothetical protein